MKQYIKPKLTRHSRLKSVTFSTHEITDAKTLDDYYAEYTWVHTDNKGKVTTGKEVGLL